MECSGAAQQLCHICISQGSAVTQLRCGGPRCSCCIAWNVQVQPNNYAAFYDDSRQSWSLAFESELSLRDFAKQVVVVVVVAVVVVVVVAVVVVVVVVVVVAVAVAVAVVAV